MPILNFFENKYIGRIKSIKSLCVRSKPRFGIDLWNVHDRVKKNLPRTNNEVESWHSRIKPDAKQNLSEAKEVELFRQEQSLM